MELVNLENSNILDMEVEVKMTVEEILLLLVSTGMTSNAELKRKLEAFNSIKDVSRLITALKRKNKDAYPNNNKLYEDLREIVKEIEKTTKGEK